MSDSSRRAKLRQQIRASSKEAFVLNEMKRLGFWPENKEQPSVSELLIQEETTLNKELRTLLKEQKVLENKKRLLRKIRKERMEASRKKQKLNREKREAARKARLNAWQERQKKDIIYLGEEVSAGLNDTNNKSTKLQELGLPIFDSVEQLAARLGISISQLRFLAYNRKVSKVSHYKRFYMPKKSGGKRLISAPMPLLKKVQYGILHDILYRLEIQDTAYGFVPQRSIKDNAQKHLGKSVVINMDLRNFFPTISYKRVKGLFQALGYAQKYATILALLCTEPATSTVEMDGQQYFVATSERHLPQGAPTSPVITNLICRSLDKRLLGAATPLGFTFTRYADDLTFSCAATAKVNIGKLLWISHQIVKEEGFIMHPDKLRIMHKGRQQEVTGIVVNEKLNISRKKLKNFRALLFQIEKDGFEGKSWNNSTNLPNSIQGYANFIAMVHPEKGKYYKKKVKQILKQYGA
jgi:retron-type reverse transcriptase